MLNKTLMLRLVAALFAVLSMSQTADARRLRFRAVPTVHTYSDSSSEEAAPSQGAFAPGAMDEAERERKIQMIRDGILVERREGESDASYEQRKSDMIALFRGQPKPEAAVSDESTSPAAQPETASAPRRSYGWVGVFILFVFLMGIRKIIGGVIGLVRHAKSDANDPVPTEDFEQRMSRRMAELNRGG